MRNSHFLAAFAVASLLGFAAPSLAQDETESGRTLPAICTAEHDMSNMDMGGDDAGDSSDMDQPHRDLMAGMADMDRNMSQAMMAEDIDVAFVCGMIPHHQGAIDMARAELAHGDDPWARQMAQKVIDAQTQEIADMLDWLETQSR